MVGSPLMHTGRCHCGAIRVSLEFTRPAGEIEVRACQCSFCTRQGARTVSDANGRAVFEIEAGSFAPYQFGTRTGTSLICGTCGVYAGVALTDGDRAWSVANARGLALGAFDHHEAVPMTYEAETAAERVVRRKQKWTPTEIRFKL